MLRSVQFSLVAQSCPTASLSITSSWSLLKLMSIESVMPSNHLILCHLLLLLAPIPPSIRVFSNSQFFALGGQNIGVSASASVLPMNTQDWSPSGWTGWISLPALLHFPICSTWMSQDNLLWTSRVYCNCFLSTHWNLANGDTLASPFWQWFELEG